MEQTDISVSERVASRPRRFVDVMVDSFGKLPSADDLLEKPELTKSLIETLQGFKTLEGYGFRSNFRLPEEPPKSLENFPFLVTAIRDQYDAYGSSSHSEAKKSIFKDVSLDYIRGENLRRLVFVKIGPTGDRGNPLLHTPYERIKSNLELGLVYNIKDAIKFESPSRNGDQVKNFREYFPEIKFKNMIGQNFFPKKGAENDILRYDKGVIWSNRSNEIVFSLAKMEG